MTFISNNRTSFKKKYVKKFLKKYHIQYYFSTSYYSRLNGKVQASNKIIEKILRKIINKHEKECHTQLSYALLAYRTSVCIAMGTTPYNLVYGAYTIMPLELEIPSLQFFFRGVFDNNSYRE